MKKKGFTIIELLTVIIILAILALISVPIIINIIEKAEKNAFEETANRIMHTGRIYYADKMSEEEPFEGEEFIFPEAKGLSISGKKPKGGYLKIGEQGNIELFIYNDKYCVSTTEEENIKIHKKEENICNK